MDDWNPTRLTGTELMTFFKMMFPGGFAGDDVVQELAPEKWENSSLIACFHPTPEQVLQERLQIHRRIEEMRSQELQAESRNEAPKSEPTMEEVMTDWKDQPVDVGEEVTELVARGLWDVFSNNHEVVAPDGRMVDIGSFRGASAFLDEYVSKPSERYSCGDEERFYLGTVWLSWRADLSPIYRLLFRRLKSLGANWEYHFRRMVP